MRPAGLTTILMLKDGIWRPGREPRGRGDQTQTDSAEIDEAEFRRGRLDEARLGFVTELREETMTAGRDEERHADGIRDAESRRNKEDVKQSSFFFF